jgi:hypothetical protein
LSILSGNARVTPDITISARPGEGPGLRFEGVRSTPKAVPLVGLLVTAAALASERVLRRVEPFEWSRHTVSAHLTTFEGCGQININRGTPGPSKRPGFPVMLI